MPPGHDYQPPYPAVFPLLISRSRELNEHRLTRIKAVGDLLWLDICQIVVNDMNVAVEILVRAMPGR
jgi:hypothetical protein